ncbi:hypothetical protein AGLY_003021 [Aphis glycines]|uniref:Uncharacterized protein n=1 Tax=Aphis glycines TaxID=307491 RepID=A0A6G0U2V2_APHGL|nr:hypothetical protein AGLY_003021 [Aphis glycines]
MSIWYIRVYYANRQHLYVVSSMVDKDLRFKVDRSSSNNLWIVFLSHLKFKYPKSMPFYHYHKLAIKDITIIKERYQQHFLMLNYMVPLYQLTYKIKLNQFEKTLSNWAVDAGILNSLLAKSANSGCFCLAKHQNEFAVKYWLLVHLLKSVKVYTINLITQFKYQLIFHKLLL